MSVLERWSVCVLCLFVCVKNCLSVYFYDCVCLRLYRGLSVCLCVRLSVSEGLSNI